jgi:hypothetical protein
VVLIIHKDTDLILELGRASIMFQKNEIFHGTAVSLYLSLRHRMIRLALDVADPFFFKIITQGFGNIAGTVMG